MTHQFTSDISEEQETHFIARNDHVNRWGNVVGSFQMLPGLVGFWPMSSVQRSTGNAYDLSGQGRTLTYNGNPQYQLDGMKADIVFDGTGDYLSRADETDLDILGTETIYTAASRGLTLGGWFRSDNIATQTGLIGKFLTTGDQRSYWLQFFSSQANMAISSDGTVGGTVSIASGTNLSSATWYFVAGRFDPSSELAVFVNGVKTTNVTSIPASIFNSTANLEIGALNGGAFLFTGRATLCFLSANRLSDTVIQGLYQQTKDLFVF